MKIIIIFVIFLGIILLSKFKYLKIKRNKKLFNFKKRLLSKEFNIEKIYTRNDEKTSLDPNININIGLYDVEENITRKSNIHRARLAKFKKSKLNGDFIYLDKEGKIFRYQKGKKKYIK